MKLSKICTLMLCAFLLCGCAADARDFSIQEKAEIDLSRLQTNEQGIPVLNVYVTAAEKVERMDVETYVQGVLAGEMKNDWPMEALKAQAILARTFVLKFVQEKESRYKGADISTDIEEAQAYDASAINQRIRQAVGETEGLVLVSGHQLPYAWFHAHSGGVTELAKAGLGWDKEEPGYTQSVKGNEPDTAEDVQALRDAESWEANFTFDEMEAACAKQGVRAALSADTPLSIGKRGESGRAVTLNIGAQSVQAAELRLALGRTKMRSTLLTSLKTDESGVVMAGKGYGHGVGMSQWGAYGMAHAGKTAQEIVTHYFRDASVARAWQPVYK